MPRYQVSFWAENIKKGWWRKPNCYATLETGDTEIGKTETKEADRSPDWIKILYIEADASKIVPLTVKLYHERDYESELLGEANFEATEVNQAPGHYMSKQLESGGNLSISVVESNPKTNGKAIIHLRGLDIRNVEPGALGLGRSDPFFEVSKKTAHAETGTTRWNVIHRSEAIEDHLNPFWEPFQKGLEELCDGDLDSSLRIAVYDNKKGAHRLIGGFEASVNQLSKRVGIKGNADREMAFELSIEGSTDTFGLICVLSCELEIKEEYVAM